MRYVSTRGGMQPAAFTDILLEGLAPDGGLAIPETDPRVDRATLAAWRPLDYRALALEILARYVDDIPRESLKEIVDRTYTARIEGTTLVADGKFAASGVCPGTKVYEKWTLQPGAAGTLVGNLESHWSFPPDCQRACIVTFPITASPQ